MGHMNKKMGMKPMMKQKMMKMRAGGKAGAQALVNKLNDMGITPKKGGGAVNKPADKLLLQSAAMGIEMDMVKAGMGKSMDYMMKKGGMMKGKMPKRSMRAAGAIKRKKGKKK